MGVVKIRRQGPRKDDHVKSYELVRDDRLLSEKDHSDDPDDSETSDAGCEHALVNDQTSNIPYELYELPNLKEILSLETWNLYLTEEERFHLAAYLPDMDQETFEVTLIELLGGGNLFFGSPLEILFCRLKGGFYSLQVTFFRERLRFLQERGYHHSLRSYHDSLSQKFVEMKKAWSNCEPSTSVEERVQILKNKKKQKPVLLVDLNVFPHDEELSSRGVKKVMGLPALTKPTFMKEEAITHIPAMDLNKLALSNRTKAKGVLKIKPPEMNSLPKRVVQSLPTESSEPFRRPPKGVLRIKPKVYHTSLVERPRTAMGPPEQGSPSVFGVQASKPSTSRSTSKWQDENISKKLNYVHKFVRAGSVYKGSPTCELTNDRQSEDTLNIGSRQFDSAQSSLRKMTIVRGMKMPSDDSSDFRECFNGHQKGDLWPPATGLHQPAHDNDRRKLTPFHTNVSEAVSRSMITADGYQVFPAYPDHSEHPYRDKKDGEGVEKSHMFPITYKRKKPHTKLSASQSQKKISTVASMAIPAGANFNQVEKTKAIKIRVKGLNEFNSKYKQGRLDGQHHGCPST
ncbi:uncharacterized protein LOC110029801 [Phalaenopsis equestris]|uniref:uncharacterized protein LOC110029801 n=1 Tax=Phalaenopsis equestris TaxID=78828 RepID=UPI0009E40AEE|nr:uncharacterized protein LOC110029801 [Phalaenopsis equestris]XP_020587906.1 uncharacterized protein LOC110029801 [Phalaenopsis equestris]XP_020587907.1 uncharacterized protein LOC110029801 [Phalaenopsis equestris]XP_020587908.1 uncharacterized protein LOC110029801 [Phalaenopsis equestris]XP_020587909.1 uncharacterized protein LOC110029801 [Phalaenopsis equestris]XP_020587910.1 uncharacterized protein LOC110029801 [Phalaenopsis equestris]